jgi:hypothetical protein
MNFGHVVNELSSIDARLRPFLAQKCSRRGINDLYLGLPADEALRRVAWVEPPQR